MSPLLLGEIEALLCHFLGPVKASAAAAAAGGAAAAELTKRRVS
jgi:hypothetical protein